jgi:hypothetical protein
MRILTLLFTVILTTTFAQQGHMDLFAPLMDRTWTAEGNWGDGSPFFQQVHFSYDLEGSVVIARSKGFIDTKQTQKGQRNLGLRRYDSVNGQWKFWEFDAFGGLTTGTVTGDSTEIRYTYTYGEATLTDLWKRIDANTYRYVVGSWGEADWDAIYLDTEFRADPISPITEMFARLKTKLEGAWSSPAWDGTLREYWKVDGGGDLVQSAEYEENGVVSYRASNRIQLHGDQLVLYTLIEGNAPKIFQATFFDGKQVVFHNQEYTNPNRVTYLLGENGFQRIIAGTENGEPVRYIFNFTKLDQP